MRFASYKKDICNFLIVRQILKSGEEIFIDFRITMFEFFKRGRSQLIVSYTHRDYSFPC